MGAAHQHLVQPWKIGKIQCGLRCFTKAGPPLGLVAHVHLHALRRLALNGPGHDVDFGRNETGILKHVTLAGIARISGDHYAGAINDLRQ